MFLINTTPHVITIFDNENKEIVIESHPEHQLRVKSTNKIAGEIEGIRLTVPCFTELEITENLMAILNEGETIILCSLITAQAVKEQYPQIAKFFYIPQDTVRDEHGKIIGCCSLCWALNL